MHGDNEVVGVISMNSRMIIVMSYANVAFTTVNEECIDTIVKNMNSKSSTGYDGISNKLIKQARAVLVKPLTLLMNQIIHTGEFPDQIELFW